MSRCHATPRVVVTGIGAVSAYGWGIKSLREGLRAGRTGIARCRRLDTTGHRTQVAGEVPPPPDGLIELLSAVGPLTWSRLSAADRCAVAATDEACRRAGWPAGAEGTGLFFGGSTAGMAECETFIRGLLDPEADRPGLSQLTSQQINGPGDAVARHRGVTGPVQTVSSACASGALAIAEALWALRDGELEVALAGGADALCQLTYGGFNSLRSMDERPCRPFRPDRAGLSIGEGAGVLVLERLEHATARGARPLAELLGAGASCDAVHMTAPHPEGLGAADAIRQALADAGLPVPDEQVPDEQAQNEQAQNEQAQNEQAQNKQDSAGAGIDMINAHGTGTPLNDLAEARAIAAVFGSRARSIPITATKASLGHLLGCSGAIEAVATVLCLLDREVYPTPHELCETTDAVHELLEVDLVTGEPRPLPAGAIAVSTSFAFGGANAALVLADLVLADPILADPVLADWAGSRAGTSG